MTESSLRSKLSRAIFRVGITTFLATLLSFAISLFFALVAILLVNMTRGSAVSVASAYRHVAFPVAMGVLLVTFVTAVILEIRKARREQVGPRRMHRAA